MKRLLLSILLLPCLAVLPSLSLALPTQFGDSGLLSQPSAETLDAGNICIGVWGNQSSLESETATIVPVSITLGLGTFLEAYGSYPNLLFNGDEDKSGRGHASTGFKLRIWGKRSSALKVALDAQGRRSISDDPQRDGLTDYLGRMIVSLKAGKFGLHANAGRLKPESPEEGPEFEEQLIYGGGIEFYPTSRLRLIAEMAAESEKLKGGEELLEGTLGFQYFLSPHLTFNFGFGSGLSDAAPDWRVLLGFSTCQGIGTYTKPIPSLIEEPEEVPEKPKEAEVNKIKLKTLTPLIPKARKQSASPAVGGEGAGEGEEANVKKLKIKTLTPLIPKPRALPKSPVSKLEVPVEANEKEVVIDPTERLQIPDKEKAKALPISPVGGERPMQIAVVEEPIIAVVHRKFRLPEFSFGYNQWDLSEEGKKALSEVLEQLRQEDRWFFIRVEGHTDSRGSESYNDKLSLKRAVSAGTHIVLHDGFDPARIFVRGLGESQPLASNDTAEGRSRNRRIELLVLVPKAGGNP